jgi:F0F1-type ATP synthase assembly protein I
MSTELPQPRITIANSPIAQIGLIVIVCAALLDLFDMWGRFFAPELLSGTACSLLPATTLIWSITYHQSFSSAYALCARGPIGEPAVSIIFLMLKMSIAVVAIVPPWILPLFSLKQVRLVKERLFTIFDKPNGLREQIRDNGVVVVVLGILCWVLFSILTVNHGPTISALQKPIEDIVAALTYLFSFMVIWCPITIAEYLLIARRSASEETRL